MFRITETTSLSAVTKATSSLILAIFLKTELGVSGNSDSRVAAELFGILYGLSF